MKGNGGKLLEIIGNGYNTDNVNDNDNDDDDENHMGWPYASFDCYC